ncbi:MAG: hypothetical protein Q9214_007527 [Letrouitia sp. 1 TL-2023]
MHGTQDNHNMKNTWAKMMEDTKRVEQAAWHVLDLALQIHQDGYPIPTNKPSSNKFEKFGTRWYEICKGLMYEKTMCKHLCGTNFSEQFVNDPKSATLRVQNNRKVNKTKSAVISQGRQAIHIALGDPKPGSSSLTRDDLSDIDDYNDEEDWEKEDFFLKLEEKTHPQLLTGVPPPQSTSLVHKPRSRRYSAREKESGSEYEAPPPRKQRESRSKYQLRNGEMVNTKPEDRYNDSDYQRNMMIATSQGRVTRRKVYEMQNQNLRQHNLDSSKQQQAATYNESDSDMVNAEDEDAEGEVDHEYSGYGGDQSGLPVASTGHPGHL